MEYQTLKDTDLMVLKIISSLKMRGNPICLTKVWVPEGLLWIFVLFYFVFTLCGLCSQGQLIFKAAVDLITWTKDGHYLPLKTAALY